MWNEKQLACITRIYIEILSQDNQLDGKLEPIIGSRFHTLHKNAHDRPTGKAGPEFDHLFALFASIDPQFTVLFNDKERLALFDAISFIVSTPTIKAAAPYNLPPGGLIY